MLRKCVYKVNFFYEVSYNSEKEKGNEGNKIFHRFKETKHLRPLNRLNVGSESHF